MTDRILLVINKMDWMLAEQVVHAMKFRFPMIEFSLSNTPGTICISVLNIAVDEMITFMAIQIFAEGLLRGMNILESYKEYQRYKNN